MRWQVHEVKLDAGGAFVSCVKVMDLKGHKSQARAGALAYEAGACSCRMPRPQPCAGAANHVPCCALEIQRGFTNQVWRQEHALSGLLQPVLRSNPKPYMVRP